MEHCGEEVRILNSQWIQQPLQLASSLRALELEKSCFQWEQGSSGIARCELVALLVSYPTFLEAEVPSTVGDDFTCQNLSTPCRAL